MPKNSPPFISVIMNCYNGEKYLKQSVSSIINQKYKNWELIFWDNQSKDNSKKILSNFKDKRIRYFKSKKFVNLYKARNLAIKKARGKFLCFLDTDDWWDKNKLRFQVNLIKQNKKASFIYSNFYIYDQDKKSKKLNFNKQLPEGQVTQFLLNNYKLGIITVMIKKKLFNNKKFNEKYNIIGDFDFFLDLSLHEYFFCIQKPLAYYRLHNSNFSKKIKIYINEFKSWLRKNEKKYKELNYSIFFIKYSFLKLKVKNFMNGIF